jgi:hypothetical protein
MDAYRASHYPGARLKTEHSISFEATDWLDVMRLILFAA